MGGVDWSGFGLVAEKFGVDDPEDLIDRLMTIKNHKGPKDEASDADA
jgi:hypothetical protein